MPFAKSSQILASCLLLASCAGCSTVTMRPKGTARLVSEPTYESSKPYFLWGLVGEHRIDAQRVCGKQGVAQVQAQDTVTDGLLTLVTFGIYKPRTARIWCGDKV